MIERFRVQNYKALRDVTLDLTPVHVLIGPNDSGKTSILEAFGALSQLVENPTEKMFPGRWVARDLVWYGAKELAVHFHVSLSDESRRAEYHATCAFPAPKGRDISCATQTARLVEQRDGQEQVVRKGNITPVHQADGAHPDGPSAGFIRESLGNLHTYRWIPSQLAWPVAFGLNVQFRMLPSGFGLPTFLNDILGEDHQRYARLEQRFREFFPYVSKIRLRREGGFASINDTNPNVPGYGISFELKHGRDLPAAQASDGLLLVLAYLAILFSPRPPRLLLIEEPENGIHPRRLASVLTMLKEMVRDQQHTQVVLTTHSPYVVDLFKPEEVTLCLKDDEGAVTTHRLADSKAVREQMDIFQLGEIWTAEGDEALAERAAHP